MKWLVACVALLVGSAAWAQGEARPRLVVLVVVDQLSASQFELLQRGSTQGFRRVVKEGFRFQTLEYATATTQTAPGHATLSTGVYGELHGIVANEWFNAATQKPLYICTDPTFRVLGREPIEGDATAPTQMRVGALGEAFKVSHPHAKVVTIAGKDRGAMFFAGRTADVALWMDYNFPVFTSSTLYANALPSWVNEVNEGLRRTLEKGYVWTPLRPQRLGGQGAYGRDFKGFGKSFPHAFPKDSAPKDASALVLLSPLSNEAVTELSIRALDAEKLGADDVTDLLTVSYSGYDRVLHVFGPGSPEALDTAERIDSLLNRLISALDSKVGKGRYTLALTSDHGGAPIPDVAKAAGVDAGRVDTDALVQALEAEADKRLGARTHWAGFHNLGVYAQPGTIESLESIYEPLRKVAREQPGVADLISKVRVSQGRAGPLQALFQRGLDAERSPDFFIVPKSYWTLGLKDVAGHATTHRYDRLVPLVLMGAGIRSGRASRAEAIDVAPTLSFLAGYEAPAASQGRILEEALTSFGSRGR